MGIAKRASRWAWQRVWHPVWLCALLAIQPTAAFADDSDTIFTRPPTPEKLAQLLFGPKYRSAVTPDPDAPGRFGMMINFEYNSVKIVPKSLPLLDTVGEMLQLENVSDETLVIEGHADASGPEAYNQNLSERRADAIKRYLVGTFDVPTKQLVTLGAGETDLYDREDPYHAINRRVMFRTIRSIVID